MGEQKRVHIQKEEDSQRTRHACVGVFLIIVLIVGGAISALYVLDPLGLFSPSAKVELKKYSSKSTPSRPRIIIRGKRDPRTWGDTFWSIGRGIKAVAKGTWAGTKWVGKKAWSGTKAVGGAALAVGKGAVTCTKAVGKAAWTGTKAVGNGVWTGTKAVGNVGLTCTKAVGNTAWATSRSVGRAVTLKNPLKPFRSKEFQTF